MADIQLDNQVRPVTPPGAGSSLLYPDSASKILSFMDDAGFVTSVRRNASIANQTGFAADTYLVGSNFVLQAGIWQVRTMYEVVFDMVKTAAGTAAFTVNIRMGTLGTTGDASVCSLAFAVGTAAADTGLFRLLATFRSVGSGTSAVVQGMITCRHALAVTGLITTGASGFGLINTTGGGFNSTTQTNIGISVNGGTSFAGTNTQVQSELWNV